MTNSKQSRPRGTGSLYELNGNWYATVRVNGKQVKRNLGPRRQPGTAEGLTKTQAEGRLRDLMHELRSTPPVRERMTIKAAGERLIAHLEAMGRRPSTLEDYRSMLRVHLDPYFDAKPLAKITPADVESYITAKASKGQAVKTTLNQLGVLHGIFEFAIKRGWLSENPCRRVDKPRKPEADTIRFLSPEELEALLRATPDAQDRTLFRFAAMTGLRRGEQLALRWADIDWRARRVRVRENIVRGRVGKPKSKRSTRSVPLAASLAGELDRHFKRSNFQADDDLVFCRDDGTPLDPSRLRKRFKAALTKAGVRQVRYHDLRHTFGTRMAARPKVSLRTLQEWMGHRDFATTLIYADYQPGVAEADEVEAAFRSNELSNDGSDTKANSETLSVPEQD